jgi:hypothetical protein
MRRSVALLAAVAMTGCSGLAEVEVLEPVLRAAPDARPYLREATPIGLGEATLFLYPVALSERMKRIYGPLLVLPTPSEEKQVLDRPLVLRVGLEVPGGTATVDLSKTAVTFGGRTLYPTSVGRYGTQEKVDGPVQVSGQRRLRNLVLPHVFELSYDVRATQLEPFTLQLPDIQVNDRVVTMKPAAFGRGKRDEPRR